MKLFESKKAVSPLVATALLVVFALILGVVVMAVGGDYLSPEEGAEKEPAATDILHIINICRDKGAITPQEYDILKEKLG